MNSPLVNNQKSEVSAQPCCVLAWIHTDRPAATFVSSNIATALSQCRQLKMHHDYS